MSLSGRDRKVLLFLVPLIVAGVYWFMLLSPKREEASKAAEELTTQTERRDAARAQAQTAQGAETNFAADYAEIVRLGKAIPASVDMPSLLVQLESAAEGTGIRFTRIAAGPRDATAPAAAPPPAEPESGEEGDAPVEAGGQPAASAPGGAAEAANDTAQTAAQRSDAATQSGVDPSDTQTSTSSGSGLPVGGGAATAQGGQAATGPVGLETIPLEMEFVGNFFSLADFFHDLKRFVRVANQNVVVSGRLVTVDGVRFSSDTELFPRITAEIKTTVYLSPKAEGATAGATAQGPAPVAPGTQPTPANAAPGSTPSPAPTATATP
jgi:Tfp pilus assembly protein PilO